MELSESEKIFCEKTAKRLDAEIEDLRELLSCGHVDSFAYVHGIAELSAIADSANKRFCNIQP